MDFTEEYNTLERNLETANNGVLAYPAFVHNGWNVRLLYLHPETNVKVLVVMLSDKKVVTLSNFYIVTTKNRANMTLYFDDNIYQAIKSLIKNDGNSTEPLANDISQHILNTNFQGQILSKQQAAQIFETVTVRPKHRENRGLYFNHLRTAHLSKQMSFRLHRTYGKEQAQEIVKALRKRSLTPIFVPDTNRARNLLDAVEGYLIQDRRDG